MQGAPHLAGVLETELAALVSRKTCIIQSWIAEGKMAPVEPRHLIFMIWATTQHYADFATQIRALTGTGLADAAFFEQAKEAVTNTILNGVLTR